MKTFDTVMTGLAIGLFSISTAATAATVSMNGDQITFSGQLSWVAGSGIEPIRGQTSYEINLPIAGSPFDPDFDPPPPVHDQQTPPVISRDVGVSVGAPTTEAVNNEGTVTAQMVDYDGDRIAWPSRSSGLFNPQPLLNDQFVWDCCINLLCR